MAKVSTNRRFKAYDVGIGLLSYWLNEFRYFNQSNIKSLQRVGQNNFNLFNETRIYSNTYLHYSLIIQESNTAVGCALAEYDEEPWEKVYLFACNYATNNRYGCPVYKAGNETSGCVTGPDLEFPSLCNVTEPINPNLSTCASNGDEDE